MGSLGFFDGKFIAFEDMAVAIEDRGYQFGDGVYEATHVYNKKCFALNRHLDRCVRSMRELRIPIVYTHAELEEIHKELIVRSGFEEALIYFQITRGTAPRDHHFPEKVVPHLSMTIRPGETRTDWQANGIHCIFAQDQRWLRCDIKSLNLLGNILAKQEAHEKNCPEALLVRKSTNTVTEGASSNAFIVKDGLLWTHPLSNLILKGVTRSILLEEVAPKLGVTVVEKAFTPEFAMTADEVFVTNTSFQIMPVVKLDGKQIGSGNPGEITLKLQKGYKEIVQKECF